MGPPDGNILSGGFLCKRKQMFAFGSKRFILIYKQSFEVSIMKVGDRAYIIVSGRIIREVELVGVAHGGFIVRFVEGGGGLAVNRSRLYKLKDVEDKVEKRLEEGMKDTAKSKGKRGYCYWEVGA